MLKFLAVIYCPLIGEPRVSVSSVDANEPVGVLDKEAYDLLGVAKSKTEVFYFELDNFVQQRKESKNDLRDRLLGILGQIIEDPLASTHTIKTIWPNGPPGGQVHVAAIEKDLVDRISSIGLLRELHPRYAAIQARDKNFMAIKKLRTPSECAKDPEVIYTDPATLGGRPLGGRGLPVALYNSSLAVLTDDLANLDSRPAPSAWILKQAMEIIRLSLEFYPKETDRERAIGFVLSQVLPGASWQKRTLKESKDDKGGVPDVTWPDGGVFELKNEKGFGGDPTAQTIADYEKIVATHDLRGRSAMPMVLLSLASTQLEVCAAVYTDVAQVDHLFSMNFHDSVHLEEQVLRLGRVLEVLQTCLTDLKTHYTTLRQNLASLPPADGSSVHLPSPVSVSAEQPSRDRHITADLNLRFLFKLSRDTGNAVDPLNLREWQANTQHGVFVALGGGRNSIPNEEKVIVKFARRYNTEAHKMLAEKNLAPKLYYHCSVRGGLIMVVMEQVQGIMASLWNEKTRRRGTPRHRSVYNDVKRAVEALHSNNLVFGDLRLQNIMVWERNDEAHAVLVDFDWAGTAGEGRYPATISDLREWAPTVEAYSVMEKEHDLHRLRAIARDDFKLI